MRGQRRRSVLGVTVEERSGRLRSRAGSAARGAGAATQRAGGELVEAVGRLAAAAVDRVVLSEERVTSAAEGKRRLAGESDTEALADKVQRVVVLATPIVRVMARGARFTRLPWAMIASSSVSIGLTVRTGVRELQVLASLVAYRLEQTTGAPSDPRLVKKIAIDLYLNPKRAPDPTRIGCAWSGSRASGCCSALSGARHRSGLPRHSMPRRSSTRRSSPHAGAPSPSPCRRRPRPESEQLPQPPCIREPSPSSELNKRGLLPRH